MWNSLKIKWLLSIASLMLLQSANQAHAQKNLTDGVFGMQHFFERLKALENGTDSTPVVIVQIGDSHTQADYWPNAMRDILQARFGDAGYGLTFPHSLQRSNSPLPYTYTGSAIGGGRIVGERKQACGMAGGFITLGAGASLSLIARRPEMLGEVKELTLFFDGAPIGTSCQVKLAQGEDTVHYLLGTMALRECNSVTFEVIQPASSYRFQFSQGGCDSEMVVYGVSIGSGKPGVQVHTVGINGARFVDYASSRRFSKQIGLLKPDLILIAMGTNETVYGLDASGLASASTQLISALRASSPESSFFLISPPDSQRKARRRVKVGKKWVTKTNYISNQFSRQAGEVLAEVADQQDAAYFDLMQAMGGFGSMSVWARNGWAAYDHLHFSESGYSRIGRMITESILEAYEIYKKND